MKLHHSIVVCCFFLFETAILAATVFADLQPPKTNIVFVIADDLGYGETGMMGNDEIPTPAIDALATRGVRCTTGYVTSSYCSPSRAGMMTGRYQSRFGYDFNPTGERNLLPNAGLPTSEVTFVSRLKQAGYETGLVGKWHLGARPEMFPTRRGFDSFYGFLHEGHFYVPGPPYQNVLTMVRDRGLDPGEFVREQDLIRGNYTPMSEPSYDAHNPILRGLADSESESDGVLREIIENDYLTDAITNEAVSFIDAHAEQADPFCLVVAYNAVHSPMQALHRDLETMRRIKNDQRRIFAGMLVALDRGVGRIVDALDMHRLLGKNTDKRQTLVVFVSDNGGPTKELTSSNAPLRDGKGSVYEGGVRIPMIWSLPGRLPENATEDRVVLSLDVAATALDLAEIEPRDSDLKMDGVSVLSWMDDPVAKSPHNRVYWRMQNGKAALRSGDWKIVRPKKGEAFELYHLASDLGEQNNLADQQPDQLATLIGQWQAMDSRMAKPIVLSTPRNQSRR